jgi:two-component system response regulator FlrC
MNKLTESVLVVEDDAALREALIDTLHSAGLAVLGACDAPTALRMLETEEVALVISDVQMPGPNGYELLSCIKKLRADLPVVLMTAYGTVAQAVAAMRDGATDYIVKPFDAPALIEMARRQLAGRVAPSELVAADPESKRVVSMARKIAETDATVLITGESGTGKEVYARFIRDHSQRREKPFVAINCAAIPENMLEATLFGYEKGAFTGAQGAHAGKFEQAARCCSTKFQKWNWGCRRRFCACCRSARSSDWGAPGPSISMCVSSRPPIAICPRRYARVASAPTFTTVST